MLEGKKTYYKWAGLPQEAEALIDSVSVHSSVVVAVSECTIEGWRTNGYSELDIPIFCYNLWAAWMKQIFWEATF